MRQARRWCGPRRAPVVSLAVPGALVTPWALRPADLIVLGLVTATVAVVLWYVTGRAGCPSLGDASRAADSAEGFEFGQAGSPDPPRARSPGTDGVSYTELSNSEPDRGPAWVRDLFGPGSAVPPVRPGDFLRSPGGSRDRAADDRRAPDARVAARYLSTDTDDEPAAGTATIRYTTTEGEPRDEGRRRSERVDASPSAGAGMPADDRDAMAPDPVEELAATVHASRALTDSLRERIGGMVDDSSSRVAAAAVSANLDAAIELPHPLDRGATEGFPEVRRSVAHIRAAERRIEAGLAVFKDP